MLLLGLLALAQVMVLPGLLGTYLFRLNRFSSTPPAIFGLSLLTNYLAVTGLVLLHSYTRPVIGALVATEVAALIFIAYRRKDLIRPVTTWPLWNVIRSTADACHHAFQRAPVKTALGWLAVFTAVMSIVSGFLSAVKYSGDGFDAWDAIQSWNRWALDWATGRLPETTNHYPQLLPANWSLPYVLTGDKDVTVFSSSLDRFFLPMMFMALLWYAFRQRNLFFALAVPVSDFMFGSWLPLVRDESYADVPVAFFSILSAVILLADPAPDASAKAKNWRLWLSAIFAFGAISTKQAGGLWVATFILLVIVRQFHRNERASSWTQPTVAIGALLLCSAAWYAFAQYQIGQGQNVSEVGYVTRDIYGGLTPLQRLALSFRAIPSLSWVVIAGTALALARKGYGLLALTGPLLYLVIWGAFFSYDMRNAAVAVAFISLVGTIGWVTFFERITQHLWMAGAANANLTTCGILILCIAAPVLILASRHFSKPLLLEHQSYYEAENLFGPTAASNGHEVATILAARNLASAVWTADRYTCLLTMVRMYGPCKRLHTLAEFGAAMMSAAKSDSGRTLVFVFPDRFRSSLEPVARSNAIEFRGSAGGFDVWTN